MILHQDPVPAPQLCDGSRKTLIGLAWANVVSHFAGLLAALFLMRPGTPAVELSARITYIANHPIPWGAGWVIWILCAFTLTSFVATLAYLFEKNFLVRMAFTLNLIAVAIDVTCDLVYILVFPLAAERALQPAVGFAGYEVLERAVGLASVVTANGLYSFLILLLSCGLPVSKPIRYAGIGACLFGMLMAVGGVLNFQALIEFTAGPTMLLFCIWCVLLSRSIAASGSTCGS